MAGPDPSLQPGHPPWEPFNVARVAGLTAGIIAVLLAVVTPLPVFWTGLVGAVLGTVVGYLVGKRGIQRRSD